ncbi:MAG TPA: phosphate--acyl-ACP acyltransferase, partial [Candidatus Aminicenantes bacterium]|nr:phosphate--acyl-ACP acyltransferase [Candidatus Aminicenantes bacterium]
QAHQLLKGMDINFIGNIEGKDVYLGAADVIVTDGFTGNVALKVTEGVVDVVLSMLRREITSNLFSKIGFFFLQRSLGRIKRRLDYTEIGGALLLGVNGLVIVGHGRSSARAIASAISLSRTFIGERVNERISQEMKRMRSAFKELNYA